MLFRPRIRHAAALARKCQRHAQGTVPPGYGNRNRFRVIRVGQVSAARFPDYPQRVRQMRLSPVQHRGQEPEPYLSLMAFLESVAPSASSDRKYTPLATGRP